MGIRFLHKTRGRLFGRNLFYPSSNIRLVLCGHVEEAPVNMRIMWLIADKNSAGKDVSQMTFNVQYVGGGPEGNGGDGWLRILEFMPDGKTIKVRTYSPLFGISKLTRHLAHRTAPYDQFDIILE